MASVFPKNFLWGAATSSHQVEGGNRNDWTEWENLGRVKNGDQSGQAADQFNRYREDFALLKSLGQNAHRFSLEWSRIEPEPGQFNQAAIDHYHAVIDELLRLGIEPMVTIHHFTNPIWFAARGGWEKKDNVEAFANFVERVAQEYASKVKYWITINEPTVITTLGYLDARWPPQKKSYRLGWIAIRHLVIAHRRAYAILHRHRSDAMVASANNLVDYMACRRWHPGDQLMKIMVEYWHNDWWLNRTQHQQDFFALNYYFHHGLRFRFALPSKLFLPDPHLDRPTSDMGWEINPAGFGRVLRWLGQLGKPIIVTENGLADARDKHRPAFLRDHLREIRDALRDGVDIRGYFHWSLLDNFEWADGFEPRFGLVAVDYSTQQRNPRPSAEYYRQICLSNGKVLDEDNRD